MVLVGVWGHEGCKTEESRTMDPESHQGQTCDTVKMKPKFHWRPQDDGESSHNHETATAYIKPGKRFSVL